LDTTHEAIARNRQIMYVHLT